MQLRCARALHHGDAAPRHAEDETRAVSCAHHLYLGRKQQVQHTMRSSLREQQAAVAAMRGSSVSLSGDDSENDESGFHRRQAATECGAESRERRRRC
jgi:hypothetical protein